MKMDHIAFCAQTDEAVAGIKATFGLTDAEWITDTVEADAWLHIGKDTSPFVENKTQQRVIYGRSVMKLWFNYDLGNELEIVQYVSGPSLHLMDLQAGKQSFFSHHGIHLAPDEPFPDDRLELLLEVKTVQHTNPRLVEKNRRYHYKYYKTFGATGGWLEYIKRLAGED